ncbi:NAD-glutamate dehydrogenase [Streptacidiphilus sp. 4-A2]|nr:NAD-glutamate dehydrogenase [Streptacidiphilus sp. 4-A2]
MSGHGYPGIGFDPVPGDPEQVAELHRRLADACGWLGEAHTLVGRLAADGPQWQGQAASAFRRHLGEGLAGHLGDARDALGHAADSLQDWQQGLLARQGRARQLDAELLALRPAGSEPADPAGLEAALRALEQARQEADRLLAEARELEQDHAADAARIAAGLRQESARPRRPRGP